MTTASSARAATAITGLSSSISQAYGSPVTLTFRLTSGSAALPGADTEVSYRDTTATVTVDGKGRGQATLSHLPVGTTTVHVTFHGDATHRAASASATVAVTRQPTEIRSLTVSHSTIAKGQDVAVTFDVYSGGKPLTGVKGSVLHDGTTTAVTLDDQGSATAQLSDLPVGANRIVVSYPGDATRDGASAPITVTVTDPDQTGSGGSGGSSGGNNPCPAVAKACVDLTNSTTWLQSGGTITYGPVPMVSGRPGYRTPAGTFQVYWKDKDHHSSLYDNAPMPNSVFFVGGVAFHEGSLSVLSHGCVHLSWDASQTYWDNLHDGDTVYVFGYAPY